MVNVKCLKKKSLKIGNTIFQKNLQRTFVMTIRRKIQNKFEHFWLRFVGGVAFGNIHSQWVPY